MNSLFLFHLAGLALLGLGLFGLVQRKVVGQFGQGVRLAAQLAEAVSHPGMQTCVRCRMRKPFEGAGVAPTVPADEAGKAGS